ncbi:hypothetical protein [Massilia brevitalea]|uniref:hypothetical protein n=1 Tax=Massilia brevitalea TaxID=442526 RepID=UPI002739C9A5|nr:hypothetical protein [Massilia brevitalea]
MAKLKFIRRPTPVLPEHRPLYKIAQILLVLHFSRGKKSSVLRLHLFNWALKSERRIVALREAAARSTLLVPAWGFDPALAIALRYAIAERFIESISNGYQLTNHGSSFIKEALKDAEIFSKERTDLAVIGKGITEAMVDKVVKDWN